MSIVLILFFISLLSIVFMIGQKLVLLRNGLVVKNNFSIEIPDIHEVRYLIFQKTRKYGYVSLIATIRFYVVSVNLFKKNYQKTKSKTMILVSKYIPHRVKRAQVKEISGFLKKISDYKHKIKRIKHQIKEEEGIE